MPYPAAVRGCRCPAICTNKATSKWMLEVVDTLESQQVFDGCAQQCVTSSSTCGCRWIGPESSEVILPAPPFHRKLDTPASTERNYRIPVRIADDSQGKAPLTRVMKIRDPRSLSPLYERPYQLSLPASLEENCMSTWCWSCSLYQSVRAALQLVLCENYQPGAQD